MAASPGRYPQAYDLKVMGSQICVAIRPQSRYQTPMFLRSSSSIDGHSTEGR